MMITIINENEERMKHMMTMMTKTKDLITERVRIEKGSKVDKMTKTLKFKKEQIRSKRN